MSTTAINRRDKTRIQAEHVLRVAVPTLWVGCLGYQLSFAVMVLGDISQSIAFFFRVDLKQSPPEFWQLLCDAYSGVILLSAAFWFATWPRAFTAIFSRGENRAWAQFRSIRAVFVATAIGLTIQSAWLAAILRVHGVTLNAGERIYRHALMHFETHLPWRHQLVASIPLLVAVAVLVLRQSRRIQAYDWIAACWGVAIFVEMNVAYGIGQARRLSHHTYGHEDRLATLGSFSTIAVVVVALLLEYRQVWQAKLEAFGNRHLTEVAAANPQPPAPSP
jgi:hypothetical protein